RGNVVEADRAGGLLHLVDRVVHRGDQAGDRTAVERGQEGPADRVQDFAGDVVRVVLPLLDLADVLGGVAAALGQPGKGIGAGDEARCLAFEKIEEIGRLRHQPLEPGEHGGNPCGLGNGADDGGNLDGGAELACAETADQ